MYTILMPIKHDISYGVLPFIKEGNEWKVFLIHQYGSSGDVFWTFPKGHPEEGESPEEAAQRELYEETGITLEQLHIDKAFEQSYTFRYKDSEIHKTVTYFLGIAATPDFSIQEDEVDAAGWFSVTEAQVQLTHDSAKALLTAAIAQLPA